MFYKKIISQIKKLLYFAAIPATRLIDLGIHRKQKKILFYSKGGLFHDNPKYLYKYIYKNKKEWRPIFILSQKKVYEELSSEYGSKFVLYEKGLKGKFRCAYHFITSPVTIIRGGSDLWNLRRLFTLKRRIVIDLCHGVPIKKTGILFQSKINKMKQEIRMRRHITYHTVSSDIERYFLSSCYYTNIYNFPITGDPRNDILFELDGKEDSIRKSVFDLLSINYPVRKFILYAPTHRDSIFSNESYDNTPRFFPFQDYNYKTLSDFLNMNEVCLLLRTHNQDDIFGGDRRDMPETLLKTPRIRILSHETLMDINEILPIIDLIITDYSGIFLDFLLLNKPIIFVPYDLEIYEEKIRGLLFDYELFTPGPKVNSLEGFLNESQEYLDNPCKDSDDRERVKRVFHKFPDGKSSERVFDLFARK